jgi:adenine-specific DNA-methyltransferase
MEAADLGRKERGAFFTPPLIADFLASWAIGAKRDARVLDPTCGEAVFLQSAASRLKRLNTEGDLATQLYGVDLHQESLDHAAALLGEEDTAATLFASDFSLMETPAQLGADLPWMDAVIGNPPFIRYQEHRGEVRQRSAAAAFAQGVRLSGMASSWASLLVHSSAFLKEDGRLAMVLPAELLTVHYAEPIRRWLRRRFAAVRLVLFERLQFADAEEQVVLLAAEGSGGCSTFTLTQVSDAEDLANIHVLDPLGAEPASEGKWTDLLLPLQRRQSFQRIAGELFTPLDTYGSPELGTVTGSNQFFTVSDATRRKYRIPRRFLEPICPPGTKHLSGLSFTQGDWEELRCDGARVWLFRPAAMEAKNLPVSLRNYIAYGKDELAIHTNYKCTIRTPWWRPPAVPIPDLYFTYMSHRYPRMIANEAGAGLVNSMHGIRLREGIDAIATKALPLLALNSATLLGAEIYGRAYGGGVLKMEPREAASLPVPRPKELALAWAKLRSSRTSLDRALARGEWRKVIERVDAVLLQDVVGLKEVEVRGLRDAADMLRRRRTREAA